MPQPTRRPYTAFEERLVQTGGRLMSALQAWVYRASGGRLGGGFLYGTRVLLLTTRGRRTGKPDTVTLIYLRDGERLIVVASKGGVSEHPGWYRNLVRTPEVEVELDGARRALRARTATAEERATLWPRLVAIYPPYETYQSRTTREIPVVILDPR